MGEGPPDGLLDLATAGGMAQLSVARGVAGGGFGPRSVRGVVGLRAGQMADIDGDGRDDLVFAGLDDCGIVVYHGGGGRPQ